MVEIDEPRWVVCNTRKDGSELQLCLNFIREHISLYFLMERGLCFEGKLSKFVFKFGPFVFFS